MKFTREGQILSSLLCILKAPTIILLKPMMEERMLKTLNVVSNLDFVPIPVWLPVSYKDTALDFQSPPFSWRETGTPWRAAAGITQHCSTWFSAMVILRENSQNCRTLLLSPSQRVWPPALKPPVNIKNKQSLCLWVIGSYDPNMLPSTNFSNIYLWGDWTNTEWKILQKQSQRPWDTIKTHP